MHRASARAATIVVTLVGAVFGLAWSSGAAWSESVAWPGALAWPGSVAWPGAAAGSQDRPSGTCRIGLTTHTAPEATCVGRKWHEEWDQGPLIWWGPDWGDPPIGTFATYDA